MKDVLTLIGYNYFALGLFGTKITKEKIRMMLSSGIKKIIVMLDDDAAGHEAQKKIVKECVNYFDTDEVFLPKGKDPNDFSENDFYFDVVDHNLVLNEAKLK